jgi:hypothetical protein
MNYTQGYIDLNNMSIFLNGKAVYKTDKLRIDFNIPVNWLLQKLFKIVYIEVKNCGKGIMLFPKYRYLSCILWNLSGGNYTINLDVGTLSGRFKISDITRKSFELVRIKGG